MMEMVWIPPGTFIMGSPNTDSWRFPNEGPRSAVTITQGFYLAKYEITEAQWASVTGRTPPARPNEPRTNISWSDVQAFIDSLNTAEGVDVYRLPTEAEWEYAGRAGTMTLWGFGDDERQLGRYAWYDGNSGNMKREVGMKLPNPWGLYDMHGNVSEWVQDWYGPYTGGPRVDPTGPVSGSTRVVRGGSFAYIRARNVRSAYRSHYSPGGRSVFIGARLLRQGP